MFLPCKKLVLLRLIGTQKMRNSRSILEERSLMNIGTTKQMTLKKPAN